MNIINTNGKTIGEEFEYTEEQKEDIIEVTLKLKLDTTKKSVQNYIERCQGKQCLASKTIREINKQAKTKE